jgi:uncharacterized protein
VLTPDLHADGVADVTLAWLHARGIRCVLVDADDTLLPGDDTPMPESATLWLASLQAAGVRVAILSNGTPRRVRTLAERLGLPSFALAGKPFFGFRRALAALDATPREAVMVGDQLFTDVLGGRIAGMHTALVRPLTPGRHAHTRAIRALEALVMGGGDERKR